MSAVEMTERLASVVLSAIEGDDPGFMTFEGIEIAHVGMEWPAMSGPVTLTMQHLADAVAAWRDDPHILNPRLKIGHEDPRFNEDPAVHDPFAYHGPLRDDGNPVYGKVVNPRLAEDGMVILGDYAEVPAWLGNVLPSAYPSRSLEGDWDVETEGGKKYSFVLTAVALLGEPLPAITCLEDLARELTGGPAAVLEQTPVTLNKEKPMPIPVAAEASTDSLRAQFFDEFAEGERYWWWPCEIRVDDAWILADDDEGHLYRVPVTVDDNGIATFGDPVAGILDFREIPDPEAGEQEPAVAAARAAVRFSTPQAAGRPHDRVRPAAATTTEGALMADETTTVSTGLLERLGLTEDATEDQIREATMARLDELETEPAAIEEPALPAASSERTVSVDREQFTQLQRDAEMGRTARLSMLGTEADRIVAEARDDGRIAPASAAAWRTAILPENATELVETEVAALSQLEKGRVPVDERGVNPSLETEQTQLSRVRSALGLKTTTGS